MTRPTPTSGLAALARLTPALLTVGCLTVALPAAAQQSTGRSPTGMRYLTWPGKVERPVIMPSPASGPASREDRAGAPGPIMTFPDAPVRAATRYSARTSPGPTPASAWIAPRSAPTRYAPPADTAAPYSPPAYSPPPEAASPYPVTYAPAPALMPEPPRDYARTAPLDATPAPRPEAPAPRDEAPRMIERPVERPLERPAAADTGPAMPAFTPPPEATPMPESPAIVAPPVEPAPVDAAPAEPAFDPMAPRRDAPIFRLLGPNRVSATVPVPMPAEAAEPAAPEPTPPQPAPAPAPVANPDASADRTPRYYSVHRANGQQPDRTPLPDPVYLDSAPVDLAEPPATPTLLRNPDGSVRAIVPNEDPTLP